MCLSEDICARALQDGAGGGPPHLAAVTAICPRGHTAVLAPFALAAVPWSHRSQQPRGRMWSLVSTLQGRHPGVGLLRWGGHVCFPLHEAAHLFSERLHHGNGSLGSGSSGPKLLTCSPDTWELQHLGEGKVAMPAGTAARRRCWARLAEAVPSLNTAPSCCLQEGDWAASLLLLSAEQ